MYNLYFIGYEMSKVTKLINSPDKFFKDLLIKRMNSLGVEVKNINMPAPKDNAHSVQEKTISFDFNTILNFSDVTTVLHCGESHNVGLKFCEQWLRYFEFYKKYFVLLVRNKELFQKLKNEYKGFNIVYAKTPIDVESLLSKLKKLKNICFLSNTANNIHLIRFNEYKHIYIGHFDESRQPSIHKYFRVYDEYWVYSEERYNRISEIIELKHLDLKLINYPESFLKQHTDYKNITYWVVDYQDSLYSSVCLLLDISKVETIQKRFFNIYSPNEVQPIAGRFLERYQMHSVEDPLLLELTDVIIMDYHYETTVKALKLGVPVIVYMPDEASELYTEEEKQVLNLCYKFKDVIDLNDILNKIIFGNDVLFLARAEYLKFHFGVVPVQNHNFKQNLNQLFVDVDCE